jgi:uncharacterized protein
VTTPYRSLLEERDTTTAWRSALPAYQSRVLGPHFEHLARIWTAAQSAGRWPEPVGEVGPTLVDDDGRAQHEIDVVALARGQRRAPARVVVLGEAKASARARTLGGLQRLEHVRDIMARRGRDTSGAALALFGRSGFDANLSVNVGDWPGVHLVTLEDRYR